eukprot:752110-Hanusia_phi.AAC.6
MIQSQRKDSKHSTPSLVVNDRLYSPFTSLHPLAFLTHSHGHAGMPSASQAEGRGEESEEEDEVSRLTSTAALNTRASCMPLLEFMTT